MRRHAGRGFGKSWHLAREVRSGSEMCQTASAAGRQKYPQAHGQDVPKRDIGQFHLITSSAVASNMGGTEMLSASATLRLIARSNLSGRCIGIYSVWRHAGFWNVPRSISWLGNARSLRRSDRRPAHVSGTCGSGPGKRRSGRREYQQLTDDPLRLVRRDRPAHALQASGPLL